VGEKTNCDFKTSPDFCFEKKSKTKKKLLHGSDWPLFVFFLNCVLNTHQAVLSAELW